MKKILLSALAVLFSVSVANAEVVAQFTSKVENRDPVDTIASVSRDTDTNITIHTVLKDLADQKVTHVWKNGENEIYSKEFNVGGPRWRVWTSVSTQHFEAGDKATVEVKDEKGNVLATETIEVK